MNIRLKIKNSTIFQLIIVLFYTLIIAKNYIGVEVTISKILIAVYVMMGVYITFITKMKANSLTFLFITVMLLSAIVTYLFGNNSRFNDAILSFVYFGVALIPVYFKLNYQLFKGFMYAIIIFLTVRFLSVDDPNFVFDFDSTGRNFISCILIIGLGYHIISCFQNGKSPSFLIITISLLFAFWATGRSGIITIGLIFLTYPFILNYKNKKMKTMLFVVSIAIAFLFFDMWNLAFQRFNTMGLEDIRTSVNSDYMRVSFSSFHNVLFAPFLNDVLSIVQLDGNPHNSFIRAHVFYGLIGWLALIILLTYTAIHLMRTKNYLFLILFLSLLVRSFVDTTSFHGIFDPLIYYLIFYSIKDIRFVKIKSST